MNPVTLGVVELLVNHLGTDGMHRVAIFLNISLKLWYVNNQKKSIMLKVYIFNKWIWMQQQIIYSKTANVEY